MQINIPQLYRIFQKYRKISTDSRQIVPGSLFFALKGEQFDGNRFSADALKKGAAIAVVDDKRLAGKKDHLLVDHVLETLQKLAIYHRDRLNIPVIGITGSNGKTTTKELISRVLAKKYRTFATTGNLNNYIGVPLSILDIDSTHEIAVIEMGANHQGEIAFLCNISRPHYGLVTNIGKAHLEGFGGYEGVIKAKGELYDYTRENEGRLFVNNDDDLLMELSEGIKRITYGSSKQADLRGEPTDSFPFLSVSVLLNGQTRSIRTSLVGNYNFSNVLAAACIGNYFGVDAKLIVDAIENYRPENNRSQLIRTKNNQVVMDAYNANPTSMELALKNFVKSDHPHKMLILGDMLEIGMESEAEHRKILRLAANLGFSGILLVGPEFSKLADMHLMKSFLTSREAMNYLTTHPVRNHFILIKGSRGIGLEKVLEAL